MGGALRPHILTNGANLDLDSDLVRESRTMKAERDPDREIFTVVRLGNVTGGIPKTGRKRVRFDDEVQEFRY